MRRSYLADVYSSQDGSDDAAADGDRGGGGGGGRGSRSGGGGGRRSASFASLDEAALAFSEFSLHCVPRHNCARMACIKIVLNP